MKGKIPLKKVIIYSSKGPNALNVDEMCQQLHASNGYERVQPLFVVKNAYPVHYAFYIYIYNTINPDLIHT